MYCDGISIHTSEQIAMLPKAIETCTIITTADMDMLVQQQFRTQAGAQEQLNRLGIKSFGINRHNVTGVKVVACY